MAEFRPDTIEWREHARCNVGQHAEQYRLARQAMRRGQATVEKNLDALPPELGTHEHRNTCLSCGLNRIRSGTSSHVSK